MKMTKKYKKKISVYVFVFLAISIFIAFYFSQKSLNYKYNDRVGYLHNIGSKKYDLHNVFIRHKTLLDVKGAISEQVTLNQTIALEDKKAADNAKKENELLKQQQKDEIEVQDITPILVEDNSQENFIVEKVVENNTAKTQTYSSINVSTINTLNKQNSEYAGDWYGKRLSENCNVIVNSGSDAVILNEAGMGSTEDLAACTGYNYISSGYNSIIYDTSKLTLVDSGTYNHPTQQGNYEQRIAVYGIFDYGDKTVAIMGDHFDTSESFGRQQVIESQSFLLGLKDTYHTDGIIGGGDVNYNLQSPHCNSGGITYKPKAISIDRLCSDLNSSGYNIMYNNGSDHDMVSSTYVF